MRRTDRSNQITLRLDDNEIDLRDQLSRRYGIDAAGVMRQALHRWALEDGLQDVQRPRSAAKTPSTRPR